MKKTNEANMDSHILVKVGDLGLQRIQNMKFDNSSFDVEDFLERIATKIGATGEDRARNDLINNMNLNWTPLALISEKYLKRCPTADFM